VKELVKELNERVGEAKTAREKLISILSKAVENAKDI